MFGYFGGKGKGIARIFFIKLCRPAQVFFLFAKKHPAAPNPAPSSLSLPRFRPVGLLSSPRKLDGLAAAP